MKNKKAIPATQAQMFDGPPSLPQTPKNDSPQSMTPMGTPPALCGNPMKFSMLTHAPTIYLATDVADKILQGIKSHDHLKIKRKFEDDFTNAASKALETMTAHNGRLYIDTCTESNHFQEVFIAHIIEKLVTTLEENPNWLPNSKNIQQLIQKVDEALKEEDDFQLDKGAFVSWHELDLLPPPPPYNKDLEASTTSIGVLAMPIIGGSCSDGTTTTAAGSLDSNDSLGAFFSADE
jgi:hypothetical protein